MLEGRYWTEGSGKAGWLEWVGRQWAGQGWEVSCGAGSAAKGRGRQEKESGRERGGKGASGQRYTTGGAWVTPAFLTEMRWRFTWNAVKSAFWATPNQRSEICILGHTNTESQLCVACCQLWSLYHEMFFFHAVHLCQKRRPCIFWWHFDHSKNVRIRAFPNYLLLCHVVLAILSAWLTCRLDSVPLTGVGVLEARVSDRKCSCCDVQWPCHESKYDSFCWECFTIFICIFDFVCDEYQGWIHLEGGGRLCFAILGCSVRHSAVNPFCFCGAKMKCRETQHSALSCVKRTARFSTPTRWVNANTLGQTQHTNGWS